jgi:hypothetical protein
MVRAANRPNAPAEDPKKKGSPKKRDFSLIKINQSKQARKVAYVFKILKLKADVEIIWCDKTPRDDAFIHPLIKTIEETNTLRQHGLITVVRRRNSRQDNSVRFNGNDSFPRRLIVRAVDESTVESRKAILMVCREFMMRPEHNRHKRLNNIPPLLVHEYLTYTRPFLSLNVPQTVK